MSDSLKGTQINVNGSEGVIIRDLEHALDIAVGRADVERFDSIDDKRQFAVELREYISAEVKRVAERTSELEGLLSTERARYLKIMQVIDGGRFSDKVTVDIGVRDELTGVYTGSYLSDAIVREVKRARRYENPLSLVLLEIDRYHELAGMDEDFANISLMEIRYAMEENTRGSDLLARYGERHFAMLLPETSFRGGNIVATKVQRSFMERMKTAYPQINKVFASGRVSELRDDEDAKQFVDRAVGGDGPKEIRPTGNISYV